LSLRLESPIHAPKISVFGGLTPKIYDNIVQTNKRHILVQNCTFRALIGPISCSRRPVHVATNTKKTPRLSFWVFTRSPVMSYRTPHVQSGTPDVVEVHRTCSYNVRPKPKFSVTGRNEYRSSAELRPNISVLWQVFDDRLNALQFHQNTTLQLYNLYNKCIADDTKAAARQSSNCILKKNKIKYGENDFQHGGGNYYTCNVARSWHWIRQVAAPCNVAGGSGMTCHWIRPNVRHIGILHLVSILTISLQLTCHSAPFCEILSKSDHPQQKKITSRWQISALLDFLGPFFDE